ncbi:plastoglobule-localized metallopeptidase 48, chloroplastic-like isoform X2 [Silene latifolia]|uniref:plastoglobule-localized metallopeptidase 48, chloroplastic-like isoform X2 n=1 Tax=Silene latifolia TaxID=37657 RepID=UPI003D76C281
MAASISVSSASPCLSPQQAFSCFRVKSSHIRLGRTHASHNSRISISVCKAAASSSAVVFRNLDADDFRHPLDRQIPELHHLMVEAAEILNVEPPDLYVRQSPTPNAYTLAISGKRPFCCQKKKKKKSGKRPFVVVRTSLIELLTRKELQAVLAHELSHLKCDHGLWLTYANILALGAYTIPGLGGLIAQGIEEQLFRWLRAAELTCDRAALLVAQDPKRVETVISVLMKLSGGCPSVADQLNVDAFLEQACSYDKASSSLTGWYIRNAQTRQLSHPLPVLRAREIDEWSRGREYTSLLKRATQNSTLHKV